MNDNLLLAFGLTLIAGLSTGIGSSLAFFTKHTNKSFLSLSLGLSAGVMLYVSFVEMLPLAQTSLVQTWGAKAGAWATSASFFGGILVVAIIDRLIPEYENPHEARSIEDMDMAIPPEKLMRMGLLTALAIAIHNFPEGLATFMVSLSDPTIGISVAVAIAIHNIPEGIAVSVPIYFATKNRKKAFWLSFLSGISEPLGAVIGFLVLRSFFNDTTMGITFAAVAGIMVFISLDELFPTARKYGQGHLAIYGLIGGMAIMSFSLILLIA
jgi:ZIP family zinc transporter